MILHRQYTATYVSQKLFFSPRCLHCGKNAEIQGLWCSNCVKSLRKQSNSGAKALMPHNPLSTALLSSIREKNPRNINLFLELLMRASILPKLKLDCLVLVPSYRLWWKQEYSGLELLGENLAKVLKIDFFPRILEKKFHHSQHTKNGKERLDVPLFLQGKNNKVLSSLVGRNILLLDDVFTTGTSLLQAEILLYMAGVGDVYSYALLERGIEGES